MCPKEILERNDLKSGILASFVTSPSNQATFQSFEPGPEIYAVKQAGWFDWIFYNDVETWQIVFFLGETNKWPVEIKMEVT